MKNFLREIIEFTFIPKMKNFGAFIIMIILLIIMAKFIVNNENKSNNNIAKNIINNNETVANENKSNNNIAKNIINNNETVANEVESDALLLSGSELQSILGANEAEFCIENIERIGEERLLEKGEYFITAYILEKNPRIVLKTEYETLKNGGEITFRNKKWIMQDPKDDDEEDYYGFIISGDEILAITYDANKGYGFLENFGGQEDSLKDYSTKKIKFKVSNDILIGAFSILFKYTNNGEIFAYNEGEDYPLLDFDTISFDRLLELSKRSNYKCVALIKNGVVGAIRIF